MGAAGRAAWDALVGLEQIDAGDHVALRRLCLLEDDSTRMRAILAEDGEVLKRPLGTGESYEIVDHPLLDHLHKTQVLAVRLLAELGVTPIARGRLGLAAVEPVEHPPDELNRIRAKYQARRAGVARATAQKRALADRQGDS